MYEKDQPNAASNFYWQNKNVSRWCESSFSTIYCCIIDQRNCTILLQRVAVIVIIVVLIFFALVLWSNWIDSNKTYNSPEKSYNPNRTSRNPQAYVPVCSIEWPDTVVIWVGIVAMCPVISKPFVYQRLSNCPSNLTESVVLCCHRVMMIVQLLSYVFVSMKFCRFFSIFSVSNVPCCVLFHLHSLTDFECKTACVRWMKAQDLDCQTGFIVITAKWTKIKCQIFTSSRMLLR